MAISALIGPDQATERGTEEFQMSLKIPCEGLQTILARIPDISSNEKARRISVLTLPSDDTLNDNAAAL
jgi:hypothetical protein